MPPPSFAHVEDQATDADARYAAAVATVGSSFRAGSPCLAAGAPPPSGSGAGPFIEAPGVQAAGRQASASCTSAPAALIAPPGAAPFGAGLRGGRVPGLDAQQAISFGAAAECSWQLSVSLLL